MDINLSIVKSKFDLVYLYDIVIFSRIPREHKAHMKMVLALFKESGVTLKLENCALLSNRINY